MTLTRQRLTDVIQYNKDTGELIWIAKTSVHSNNITVGCAAGTIDNQGYRVIKIDGKSYKAHRLVWFLCNGVFPEEIDHINGNPDDNRIINLRNVSHKENLKNKRIYIKNKTGVHGVTWKKTHMKWVAHIKINGKQKYLGIFKMFNDAAAARFDAENSLGYHTNHGRK